MDVAILEIRGAAGGDEAKIWAQDLVRMYTKFAQKMGFKAKNLTEGVLRIKGEGAYEKLKFEAGVHRVQRIPVTERRGRIHTSTATVAVLPEISQAQIKISPNDLDWQFFRASSQGGQNVQKTSSAARLIHRPTGIVVTSQVERDQWQNRQNCLSLLRSKLWQIEEEKKHLQLAEKRLTQIGRGMRAEKIRTYNFPQNRVTDHRLGKSFYNLERILDGDLSKIIKSS